jgi:hypothetical protein
MTLDGFKGLRVLGYNEYGRLTVTHSVILGFTGLPRYPESESPHPDMGRPSYII